MPCQFIVVSGTKNHGPPRAKARKSRPVDPQEDAKAIVLDLVEPATAYGRLGREDRDVRRDERREGRTGAGHARS